MASNASAGGGRRKSSAGASGARRPGDELAREQTAKAGAKASTRVIASAKPLAVREVEADAERAVDMAWSRLKSRPKASNDDLNLMIRAQRAARSQWVYKESAKRAKKGIAADATLGDVEPASSGVAEVDDD